jgi:hypothetical protein
MVELHGGHRANAAPRSATGAVCSPNPARSARILVKSEVTAQIGRTFQAKSPLANALAKSSVRKPLPANPETARRFARIPSPHAVAHRFSGVGRACARISRSSRWWYPQPQWAATRSARAGDRPPSIGRLEMRPSRPGRAAGRREKESAPAERWGRTNRD